MSKTKKNEIKRMSTLLSDVLEQLERDGSSAEDAGQDPGFDAAERREARAEARTMNCAYTKVEKAIEILTAIGC